MTISPRAIGMFVVPELKESIVAGMDGKKYPNATPQIMAATIQSVRFLFRKLSFFISTEII